MKGVSIIVLYLVNRSLCDKIIDNTGVENPAWRKYGELKG